MATTLTNTSGRRKTAVASVYLTERTRTIIVNGREYNELLEAGVHFGHLTRKWDPKMAPYIFMERNGIHIIDLNKTLVKVDEAASAIKQVVKSGRRVLFVATKKQAKDIIAEAASKVN